MSDITSYICGKVGATYELAILRPSNALGYNFTAGTLSINTNTTSLDSANGARTFSALPTPGMFRTVQSLAVAAESVVLLAMLLENGVVVSTKTFTDPGDSSAVIVFDGYTGGASGLSLGSTSTVAVTNTAFTQVADAGGSALVQSRIDFEAIVAASEPAATASGITVKAGEKLAIDLLEAPLWVRGYSASQVVSLS